MAEQDLKTLPVGSVTIQPAAGVDELTQELDKSPAPAALNGAINRLYEVHSIYQSNEADVQTPNQGALQRLNGKKLIDANPNQKVFAIHQAFNGFGQFGYYVQTDQKLYFHTCESPKDLHINFATLQNLLTDDAGNTLDIFTQPPDSNISPPDLGISCLFEFPPVDKPVASDAGHKGVDYIVIWVIPQNATPTDAKLRTRLLSLNSGTPYDNQAVGFYKTQNACQQDSIPLVTGPDGKYLYPPTNSKYAYLAWGGAALVNVWTRSTAVAQPQIWTQVADAWQQVNAPSFSYPFRGYLSFHFSNLNGNQNQFNQWIAPLGTNPGQRIYFDNDTDSLGTNQGHFWQVSSQKAGSNYLMDSIGNPYNISYPQGGFPGATNSGRLGLIGTVFYQDVKYNEDAAASWQEPKAASYATIWVWSNSASKENDSASSIATNVGKFGYQSDTKTYWKLTKYSTWTYANFATLQNSLHTNAELKLYARETDNNSWWALTQIGISIPVTWTYANDDLMQNATGFIPSNIGKIALRQSDGTYWILTGYNRHADKNNNSEYYLINLNRLYTDFQSITPTSIQFMLRGYWDHYRNNGNVILRVFTFKGGLPIRPDTIDWTVSKYVKLITNPDVIKNCNLVASGDAKGINFALITIGMSDGSINVTSPVANTDGATHCPF